MSPTEAQAFVGRATELQALGQDLAAARSGTPRVVLLEGQPGIGKTTLVERFLTGVDGVRVVHASGEESEAEIELAMLDQLLRRAGAGGLELGDGGHVRAGTQLLDALNELQADGPVIVVIDDAHWADVTSLRALLFAVRRLVNDSVLLLIATREGLPIAGLEGLRKSTGDRLMRELRLAPLAPAELDALASASGVNLSQAAVRRLHEQSGGNPLYARELLMEVSSGTWESWAGPPSVPRSYSELVLSRLRALPEPAVRLAEAASVLGVRNRFATVAEVAALDDPYAAADALVARDVVLAELTDTPAGVEFAFVHPLVRAAVYNGIAPSRRAALHLRAAAAVGDEATRLLHRFKAAVTADGALARDFAEYATRSIGDQRWANASRAFELASRACPERAEREGYLLSAIEAAMFGGDSPRGRRLAEETHSFQPGPRLDAVLAYVCVGSGQDAEAEARLRRAWDLDPTNARVAERLAFLSLIRLRAGETVAWARTALSLAPPDDPRNAPATLWLANGLHWLGEREEAYAVLEERLERGSGAIRGTLLLAEGRLAEAAAELAAQERAVLDGGSLIVNARLLAKHAQVRFALGDWDGAAVLADRAQTFAAESDDVAAEAIAGWAAALVPAARAQIERCEALRRRLEALPAVFEAHVAERNLGLATLALAGGRFEDVLSVLAPLAAFEPREAIDAPGHYPWVPLFAEALVRLRRPEARAFLDEHERSARDAVTRACLARVRGELALLEDELSAAAEAFARARELLPSDRPYERALIAFGHGRTLRRARQRRAAAECLSGASRTFAALGAGELEPCRRELAACGLSPAKRTGPVDRSVLTPQERTVAQLAAAGHSNRAIAAELLISVKSVERYLTQVYRKLGVDSRGDLASHLA